MNRFLKGTEWLDNPCHSGLENKKCYESVASMDWKELIFRLNEILFKSNLNTESLISFDKFDQNVGLNGKEG